MNPLRATAAFRASPSAAHVLVFLLVGVLVSAWPAGAEKLVLAEGDDFRLDASSTRGLRLRFSDPDLEFRIGGRLHADAALFEDDSLDIDDDAEIRRGRLFLAGRIVDDYRFKVEYDFSPNRSGWRNVWGKYQPNRRATFTVGNFVAPFGLEDVASSNHSTFMERSLSSSLAPGFQTGARMDLNWRIGERRSRNRFTFAFAGVMEPMGQRSDDAHRSEHWSLVSRATFAPIARRRTVIHFGGSAQFRDVINNSPYSISSRPESGLAPIIVRTGGLADVDTMVGLGAEAALLVGPVLLQGEYRHSFLQRDAGRPDPSFDGGYVQASWVVTGERRHYSRSAGLFEGVTPRSDWGAVELAVRASQIDLRDETVDGGRARDLSLGVNWYIRSNVRLMFNYIYVDGKLPGTGFAADPQVFQFRFQVHF